MAVKFCISLFKCSYNCNSQKQSIKIAPRYCIPAPGLKYYNNTQKVLLCCIKHHQYLKLHYCVTYYYQVMSKYLFRNHLQWLTMKTIMYNGCGIFGIKVMLGDIFLMKLEDISPLCGVTIPWFRHLPWVSKPRSIPLLVCFFTYIQQNPHIHLWCNMCWPIGGLHSWGTLVPGPRP